MTKDFFAKCFPVILIPLQYHILEKFQNFFYRKSKFDKDFGTKGDFLNIFLKLWFVYKDVFREIRGAISPFSGQI